MTLHLCGLTERQDSDPLNRATTCLYLGFRARRRAAGRQSAADNVPLTNLSPEERARGERRASRVNLIFIMRGAPSGDVHLAYELSSRGISTAYFITVVSSPRCCPRQRAPLPFAERDERNLNTLRSVL